MARFAGEKEIATGPCPDCILCGGEGQLIYSRQPDRLFDASGLWNFKRCSNRTCRLIWLDPMPLTEDLGKAYAGYYTHASRDPDQTGPLRQLYRAIQRGYIAREFGYHANGVSLTAHGIGKLIGLNPIMRMEVEANVRFLHAMPQGRLLDVGCGSGEWLLSMRELGWQVAGVDFDENAVRVATQRGLAVCSGALEQQDFANESFDAVTLNHVIEHVPDPVLTLKECRRILKRGAKLVLVTPNSASLGHRVFKQNWRGLEPPRHLHLFSLESMRRLLQLAGFKTVEIRPFIVTSVIYESILLHRGCAGSAQLSRRNRPVRLLTELFKIFELCILRWKPSVGDCVIAFAVNE